MPWPESPQDGGGRNQRHDAGGSKNGGVRETVQHGPRDGGRNQAANVPLSPETEAMRACGKRSAGRVKMFGPHEEWESVARLMRARVKYPPAMPSDTYSDSPPGVIGAMRTCLSSMPGRWNFSRRLCSPGPSPSACEERTHFQSLPEGVFILCPRPFQLSRV